MPRQREIEAGQIWAYRPGENRPLERVRILDPGSHYDAYIRIEFMEHPGKPQIDVKRVKLPCQWDRLEEYIVQKQEKYDRESKERARMEAGLPPRPMGGLNITEREEVVLLALDRVGTLPIAYDLKSAAQAVGYSEGTLRLAINRHELLPRYANSKPIILRDELYEWAHSLPYEPPL